MTTIDALAEEFAPDLLRQALLDSINWDPKDTLMPGTDWRNGHLWMTQPVSIPTERKIGRAKDAETEIVQRPTTLLIRDDGLIREYDRKSVEGLGYRFPPIYNPELEPRWYPPDMKDYLVKPVSRTGADLHAELRALYLEYIEFADPIYYDLLPLYVLASYVYRIFNSVGYIHFNGSAASGKTQNLKLLQAFALNTQLTSNTSTAALFRSIASAPGVLCLDEAESFEDEAGKELKKLLLSGYQRGGSVRRVEKIDEVFTSIMFPVYTPKAIASIAIQDNVLASRCLVIRMTPALRRIAEFNHEDDRWQSIRNACYRWALTYGRDVAAAAQDWNQNKRHTETTRLIGRQWQISQIYFVIAEAIGLGALTPRMYEFFNKFYAAQQATIDDTDRQRLILRTLPTIVKTCQPGYGSDYYSIGDIYKTIADRMEEDELEYFKSRNASKQLRNLGFDTTKQTRGGLHFQLTVEKIQYELGHKQLEPFEEDLGWEDHAASPTLDWLDQYQEPKETEA